MLCFLSRKTCSQKAWDPLVWRLGSGMEGFFPHVSSLLEPTWCHTPGGDVSGVTGSLLISPWQRDNTDCLTVFLG